MTSRLDRIHHNRQLRHRQDQSLHQEMSRCRQASLKALAKAQMAEVRNLWLVTQRKSLESIEPWPWLRWLLRQYFAWRGFACRSHCGKCDGRCYASIEYRGVFDSESEARWAASCEGGEYKPIPFNAALPEQTVRYLAGDAPLSEASAWYRRGAALPFETITRADLKRLERKIEETVECAEGRCGKVRSAKVI